ncbi:MAG: hypothetical protein HZB55_02175 [Deltaproteobacteria bacterium]|nr:hypothetical protein [Deltaproteobacteria bacterium]
MGKPAGLQIRRWFGFLVTLLLVVNGLGLAGSIVISRSVRAVVEEAEPLANSTEFIQREILAAQRTLFQYLAEFSDAPTAALGHLDAVDQRVAVMRAAHPSPAVAAELDKILEGTDRYRKVLELLPRSSQGSRDWTRLQEYSSAAVNLGTAVEERASRLAQAAQEEIRRRRDDMATVAVAALWTSIAALTASALSVVALRHWWKRFQELILGM